MLPFGESVFGFVIGRVLASVWVFVCSILVCFFLILEAKNSLKRDSKI
jgi:hypothetical protein